MSFLKDKKTGVQTLSLNINDSEGKITIQDKETKFKDWNRMKLFDDEKKITALENIYGKDIVKKALLKAYKNKIELAFEKFDCETENKDKIIKEYLEKVSPEKGVEVNKAFREFENLANVFLATLKEKSEELKVKGVYFDPHYIESLGGYYREFVILDSSGKDDKFIKQTMNDRSAYPPRLNFDALKKHIDKRMRQIKELTEDIKKIETKEDANKFKNDEKSGINKAYKNMSSMNYDKLENWEKMEFKALTQFKSYEEALDYFNIKNAERENVKGKIFQVLENGINVNFKAKELRKEIKEQNFNRGIDDVENEISRIEKNKKDSLFLMNELIRLESELPKEQVIFNRSQVEIPSARQQLEQLIKDQKIEEQNLENLKQKISIQELNKPKLFGKNNWEKELADLKQKQKDLEEKISKMKNEDHSILLRKCFFQIPTERYSDIEKLVEEQKYIQGSPSEVFVNLKAQLNKIINHKVPSSVISLYKEYKDLEKKLS